MPPKDSKAKDIYIYQSFIDDRYPVIALKIVSETYMNDSYIDWLLQDEMDTNATPTRFVGMHPSYTESGLLAALSICVSQKVLLITDVTKSSSSKKRAKPAAPNRHGLRCKLLNSSSGLSIVAFNAHELVLALHRDMGLACARVVDLLSLPPRNRDVVQTVKTVTRARIELFDDSIREAFQTTVYERNNQYTPVQQAWFAWLIGNHPEVDIAAIPVIDSSEFTKLELDFLAKSMEGFLLRDLKKPTSETFDIPSEAVMYKGNNASWNQQVYGNRLRKSPHQVLKVALHGHVTLDGTVSNVQGQEAVLRVPSLNHIMNPSIQSVTVMGKPLPTQAEHQHNLTILKTLQRKLPLFDKRWTKILFPTSSAVDSPAAENTSNKMHNLSADKTDPEWTSTDDPRTSAVSVVAQTTDTPQEDDCQWVASGDDPWTSRNDTSISQTIMMEESAAGSCDAVPPHNDPWAINPSCVSDGCSPTRTLKDQHFTQQLAYKGALNPSQRHAVYDMLDFNKDVSIIKGPPGTGKTTVITAYIAEILSQPGKTGLVIAQSNVAVKNIGEKLFSSGITDWTLLVSSEFLSGWHEHLYEQLPQSNLLSSSDMNCPLHTRIILCTLSMLSSNKFIQLTRKLHMEFIVVEEASQIPMNNYLPVIAKFGKHIKKINFIGDDRQLPPYASESTESLYSVFENELLLKDLHIALLNIQYRMPPAIGNFISQEVYSNLLQSWDGHPIQSPLSVQFLDIDSSEEPEKHSFKNSVEASVAISIATFLVQKEKAFKIITPYEPQRDLLEQKLKGSGLPWANTCFTVDSFQGNEGDYIIISIVRTKSVGFLQDLRRSNVMLSRAKKGMFVCSNQRFLQSPGARHTLIGKMAEEWAEIEGGWIKDRKMLAEQLHID